MATHPKKKLILVDIDGVVLAHGTQFFHWLDHKGYLKGTNEEEKTDFLYKWHHREPDHLADLYSRSSEEIIYTYQEPFKDAKHYLHLLNDLGWKFKAITCHGSSSESKEQRRRNLFYHFEEKIWDEIICLGHTESKQATLEKHKGENLIWVEDTYSNALVGHKLGLTSIWMRNNNHPPKCADCPIIEADNWQEIYNFIMKLST